MDPSNEQRGADRRSADRERRHSLAQGGKLREERRQGSRRRRIAGVGLLAAAAFAGVRSYQPRASSFGTGTVDIQEESFRLPTYDRATLEPFIQEAAAMSGVSPHLVRAMVQTESQFNPLAVSPVGAKGLMQLMPGTAESVGLSDPFDPRQNVIAGAKYLSILLERYHGNTALALAGYNAGPANVKRYRGIPPFRETRGYVKKIQNLVADSDAAFSVPDPPRPKVRRASLRAGKASSRGALKRQSRATRSASAKRGVITKARVQSTSNAKVGRARQTTVKVRAKAPAKSRARSRA